MEHWQTKLTPFDAQLCDMVESLSGEPCEPKSGGDHYFIECSYKHDSDPQHIFAMWDAIEGRAGKRLMEIKDDPERMCLLVRIKFYDERPEESAFIPKVEQ